MGVRVDEGLPVFRMTHGQYVVERRTAALRRQPILRTARHTGEASSVLNEHVPSSSQKNRCPERRLLPRPIIRVYYLLPPRASSKEYNHFGASFAR